ncbi:MAG TPA: diguanylate cyclase [Actinomycetota bacterium]|nr:diguanylate cyclase [Actinomycetota bacterium]
MTLRARLTLFFTMIVVVPLVAATVVLQVLVNREVDRRVDERLQIGARAAAALWQERSEAASREVRHIASALAGALGEPGLRAQVQRARDEAGLDFVVVTSADETILADAVGRAAYAAEVPPPRIRDLLREEEAYPMLRARVEVVSDGIRGTVTGGFYADERFARALSRGASLDIVIVHRQRTVASNGDAPARLPAGSSGPIALPDGRRALVTPIEGQPSAVAVVTREAGAGGMRGLMWVIIAISLALAMLLGYALAKLLSRPLQRLAEGAMAVAGGDFDTFVPAEGQGDVARLAEAFNAMTANMRRYVGELEKSRDELRRGLDRLGATLRATHDLEGMLGVILDTAAVTLGARSGAVFLRSPSGRRLQLEVGHGYEATKGISLRIGEGIAGTAAGGMPVLIPSGTTSAQAVPPAEPVVSTAVAVPLTRGERNMGVLALYGRTTPQPFEPDDLETLGSFAGQASIAIENVLLHQEAQRLSITDGLTGVWNRRYLQLTLGKELERAQRFGRPVSVLMIDIDHFKLVNDLHGHHVGDEVLIEVTRRIMSTIRSQIDSLARYGGEEFIVVLPETPREGAKVVAEKILTVVRQSPFAEEAAGGFSLTVSIGVACYPEDGTVAEELIRVADIAMYRAKESGRDRLEVAD